MNDQAADKTPEVFGGDNQAFAEERRRQVARFVSTNPGYYEQQFDRIGSESKFTWTLNIWAGILGPIWFCARGLWNYGLSFLIIET